MTISRIKLERFTAFEKLDLNLSPGVNTFVGANGTGKTHLMKVAYAACDISKTQLNFAEKLIRVFLPSGRALGRLVKNPDVPGNYEWFLLATHFDLLDDNDPFATETGILSIMGDFTRRRGVRLGTSTAPHCGPISWPG